MLGSMPQGGGNPLGLPLQIKMVEKQLMLLASAIQASVGGDRARLEGVLDESTSVIVRQAERHAVVTIS